MLLLEGTFLVYILNLLNPMILLRLPEGSFYSFLKTKP